MSLVSSFVCDAATGVSYCPQELITQYYVKDSLLFSKTTIIIIIENYIVIVWWFSIWGNHANIVI